MSVMRIGAASPRDNYTATPSENAKISALRGALESETRFAEALAQRSRGLIDLVDTLARRALDAAHDLDEARARLRTLSGSMRTALAAGESAEPANLPALVERTVRTFETHDGPRIAHDGPPVTLTTEAARLVALTLFEIASRSVRFGALAMADGRATVGWTADPVGGLRLVWREFGAPLNSAALRRGTGAGLLELLEDRFGAPLQVRVNAIGMTAELTLPRSALAQEPVSPCCWS